ARINETVSVEDVIAETEVSEEEVKNLTKEYGENKLFKNLNFSLNKGEITSIVGKSGSGKSTLGDIILGIKEATSGEIIMTNKLNKMQLQKIYQQPPSAFLPNQTLKEGFEDLVKLHNLSMKKVYKLLEKVNLNKELLNRKPHEVSGGELQRIATIKVLLLKPAFLFADEATSRLDSISQQELIYFLLEIVKKENLSLLLVTHDLEMAEKISNKIIYLE
ncbi:MAG: ATP-binding cassette domain-containing protein, partial [Poseidonibacter sp.]